MNNKTNFSDSLTELLNHKNILIEKLADAIGVSLPTMYGWIRNEQSIKLSNLIKLATYFEVSIEYLIGRSDINTKMQPINYSPFGKRLRKVMQEKGITMYYLRKNYKYGSKHFENWDKGADPLLSTLVELSDILDCTIDYLVGREN